MNSQEQIPTWIKRTRKVLDETEFVFPVFSSDGWKSSNRFLKNGNAKERKNLKTWNFTLSHECRMTSALEWSNGDEAVLQD